MPSLAVATLESPPVALTQLAPISIDRPNFSGAAKMAERIAQVHTHRLLTFCPESFAEKSQQLAHQLNYEVDQKKANQKFKETRELFENTFFPREPGETSEQYWQRIAPAWQTTLDHVFSPNPFTFDSVPQDVIDRREIVTKLLYSGETLRLATGGDFTRWDGQWLNALLNTAWLQIGKAGPSNHATNSAWQWYEENIIDPVYGWPDKSVEDTRKLVTDSVVAAIVITCLGLLTSTPLKEFVPGGDAGVIIYDLLAIGTGLSHAARWYYFEKKR